MKQPSYKYKKEEEYVKDILHEGKIGEYEYLILDLGRHPTAYVKIPKKHSHYGKNYNNIPINVHGGLTYSDDEILGKKGFWIGWDYAHHQDYTAYNIYSGQSGKKWTTEEIMVHVESVIAQLKSLKVYRCPECKHIIKKGE